MATKKSGSQEVVPAPEEQSSGALDIFASVNLDEIQSESITVAFRERVPYEAVDELNDEKVIRYKNVWRKADIDTYVPMAMFHKVLEGYKKVQGQRGKAVKFENLEAGDPMVEWMTEQVLLLWQQSEPAMTMDRLTYGLDILKIGALFHRFFAGLTRQLGNNPPTA